MQIDYSNIIREVSGERNYWFNRTFGGNTFKDYIEKEYIGLGYNDVPQEFIKNAPKTDKDRNILLSYLIEMHQLKKATASGWTNQLIAFQHEMKVGDYVVIPSTNSAEFAIGEVISEVYHTTDPRSFTFKEDFYKFPERRRKIKWHSIKPRKEFLGDLKNISSSYAGLRKVNSFGDTLEGHVSSLFVREGEATVVIEINQDDSINAYHFKAFLSSLTYFYEEFCKESGIEINEELYIKIKMQSRGKMALKALAITGVIGLTGVIILSNNQQVKIDIGKYIHLEGESDGFLKSYTDFLNEKQERQIEFLKFQDSMQHMRANVHVPSIESSEQNTLSKSEVDGEGEQSNNN